MVLLLAVAGLVRRSHPSPARTRMVVLGAIESPDTVLALAVREAVRAQLERTPEIVVVNDDAMRQALRLMELPARERLTEGVADDVALRKGVSLVVVGTVASVGSGAQILLRLVDADRGETLASASEWARESSEIVPAVARLADQLRAQATASPLSETGALPAVTTSSIEALRDYALARASLARVDRDAAITYGEAALMQDSSFALAHYLVGDLLWYTDHEHHAEAHLQQAYQLSARLPLREQMLVRARYTQLVLDRPDSALTYWRELRAAFPAEVLGYEGAVWADLALGNFADAAAAADSALRLDSAAAPQVRNRMMALLDLGDTARALALTKSAGARWPYLEQQVRVAACELRGDWNGLGRLLDSLSPPLVNGVPNLDNAPTRQALLLSQGRLRDGDVYGELVVEHLHPQFAIRARLWQALAELEWGHSQQQRGTELLHDAIARLDSTDLSPPANARLAEIAAEVAVTAGDLPAIAGLQRIIAQRDGGRRLPSHVFAQMTLDAATALVRGNNAMAVEQLERSRRGRFYGRSMGALVLLEAAALERLGDHRRARSLYRLVSVPGGVWDDGELWMLHRTIAVKALASLRIAQQ
jgi:tetratricopeptide (TPR) repeat protein